MKCERTIALQFSVSTRISKKKEGSKGDEISLASTPVPEIAVRFLDTPKRKCGVKGLLAFFLLPESGAKACEILRGSGKSFGTESATGLCGKMKTVRWTILIFIHKQFSAILGIACRRKESSGLFAGLVFSTEGVRSLATDLKEIRFRLSEKELSRIEQLKKEFSFKSRSRLVRLLVTCSAEKLEDKIHVIPEEFGKEIHDAILAIAKDIHDTKLNLQRMGNNINQMAKATNVAKKSGAVVGTATYEIQQPQHHLERGEEYARIMKRDAEDFIQKYKKYYLANDTLYMKTYADFIHEYCANADEIIANIHQNAHAATVQNPVSVTVDFDTEQIEKLIERLDKASEELGQLLWQIK